MASYLDDQTRVAHYGVCRKKRKQYERILDICMWASILAGFMTVIPYLFVFGIMNAMFLRNPEMLLEALGKTLGIAVAIYAIYLRKWKLTVIAVAVSSLCNIFVALATAVSAVTHWFLEKLSKEEGWPLFDIPYDEQAQRKKNQESIIRNRAVALGERISTESLEDTEMHDILDESKDKVHVKLKGYHDRFRDAQPEDRVPSFEPGVMDALESFDGLESLGEGK